MRPVAALLLLLLRPDYALVPSSRRPFQRGLTRLRRSWFDDDLPNILVGGGLLHASPR